MKYSTVTEVMDFGPHISRVVLWPEISPAGLSLDPADFQVEVRRVSKKGDDFVWPSFMGAKPDDSMKGTRRVTAAYVSDGSGKAKPSGKCITLELYCHPMEGIGSIIRFDGSFNVFVDYSYTITQKTGDQVTVYDEDGGNTILLGDLLRVGEHPDPECALRYSFYTPDTEDGEKIPLIIWLHGAGEGGEDTLVAAIGNKVVNFLNPAIQAYFGGKAMLLVPQCPTMWMNDGTGEYTKDGGSMYVEPLERLIADFVDAHPQIDRSRIYLGGDSNGGFMTMKMIIRNPDRYAAAFPVCEALADAAITDADIEKIKNLPIWFTHSKDDPVVPPMDYVVPTYKRLVAAGGPNIHFTFWDHVDDQTGLYQTPDGKPFRYIGHWSWIPMLNNDCRTDFDGQPVCASGKPVPIMEWIGMQQKA